MPRHIRMKHFTDGHTEEIITDSPPPGASAGRNPICECGELRCYHFGRVEYCTNDGFEKESGPTYRFSGKYALPASAGREEPAEYPTADKHPDWHSLATSYTHLRDANIALRSALAAERAAGEAAATDARRLDWLLKQLRTWPGGNAVTHVEAWLPGFMSISAPLTRENIDASMAACGARALAADRETK